jgi:hypothetical protein
MIRGKKTAPVLSMRNLPAQFGCESLECFSADPLPVFARHDLVEPYLAWHLPIAKNR